MLRNLKERTQEQLLKSFNKRDFAKGMTLLIAMVIPITLGVKMEELQMGIFVALGVFFASPCDTSGSFKLRVVGIFLATVLAIAVTYIMHVLKVPLGVFILCIGLLVFVISYFSVYGFRASLITFAGLFAIVLSLSSLSNSELSIGVRMSLIAIGGFWYILLVVLRHYIFPKGETEYFLGETLKLTGNYLRIRAELVDMQANRKELLKDLLDLQQKLTENHETLRELLITRRRNSGKSSYQASRLLVFQELVDILELAMTNPVNYVRTDQIFVREPDILRGFQDILLAMSTRLKLMGKNINNPSRISRDQSIKDHLEGLKNLIIQIANKRGDTAAEDYIILKNYWKYQRQQLERLTKVQRYLQDPYRVQSQSYQLEKNQEFLTRQQYRLKVLVENFNPRSVAFRHASRIALAAMIGYGIGVMFDMENAYWVLLTVIVIMRPNFGLTKTRFKQRSLGTLIGGIAAFVIVYFLRSPTLYAILCILFFVIGFSMVQRNYSGAAAFFTIYVVLVYALLRPEVFDVIQYRVLDTFLGAGISFVANLLLWPSWEIKTIKNTLQSALEADRKFLEKINFYYIEKQEDLKDYKLSRKNAFLALSDLNASFQRITQEPKSQHKNMNEIFQIVMLMHSFLASLSSLGTYIISNETTPASKGFQKAVRNIIRNLLKSEEALLNLRDEEIGIINTQKEFDEHYNRELSEISGKVKAFSNWKENAYNEEASIIVEQLKWLTANSHRVTKILKKITFG